jgi:hypothetical protein
MSVSKRVGESRCGWEEKEEERWVRVVERI